MSVSEKVGDKTKFQQPTRDYIGLLRSTVRDTEARRVVAKHKTYMWRY